MLGITLNLTLGLLALAAILNLWRLVRGPAAVDRVLALDTLAINALALVAVLGIFTASTVYFEAALLIAMTGFVSTVSLCKYLLHRNVLR